MDNEDSSRESSKQVSGAMKEARAGGRTKIAPDGPGTARQEATRSKIDRRSRTRFMRICRTRVGSIATSRGMSADMAFCRRSVTSLSRCAAFMLTMFQAGSTIAATCGGVSDAVCVCGCVCGAAAGGERRRAKTQRERGNASAAQA